MTNSSNHQDQNPPDSEFEIMQRIAKGDHHAYEQLYQAFYPRVWNMIYSYVGHWEITEDLTQDFFTSLWKEAKRYPQRHMPSLKAFIFKSVRNLCIDYHRKNQKRKKPLTPSSYTPKDKLLQDEMAAKVHQALSQLPEQQFSAIILSDLEDLSYKEIATILNISERAVEGLVYRARKKLAQLLQNYLEKGNLE